MEKKPRKNSDREAAIGARLREARRFLGLSQTQLADSVGVKRVRLDSYESGVVALRCEVALRVCRRWQISEDWLATGGVKSKGYPPKPYPFGPGCRATMFKAGDPILDTVKPGARFSEAYDLILKQEYWKMLGQAARTWTRFDFSTDDPEELRTSFEAAISTWAWMIADREKARFFKTLMKCGMLLFVGLYVSPPGIKRLGSAPGALQMEKSIEAEFKKADFV